MILASVASEGQRVASIRAEGAGSDRQDEVGGPRDRGRSTGEGLATSKQSLFVTSAGAANATRRTVARAGGTAETLASAQAKAQQS